MNYEENYITSALFEFQRYKTLGDKSFEQLAEQDLFWTHNSSSNSIALIVKHMSGNMLSRWTNFLNEDGEKEWRNRETEFNNSFSTKQEVIQAWEKGWACLFDSLNTLQLDDFKKIIKIRNEDHTIFEAVNRQLAHYANHVGQIVFIAKMIKAEKWISLSIPKGKSEDFNRNKFNES